jgi:hypothetical protein
MDSQLNELSKVDKTNISPNRYKLRSKKKEGKSGIPDHPTREKKHVKNVVDNNKYRKARNPSLVVKSPVPEVRKFLKPPSSFNLEHEIQKVIIPLPLSYVVKHEDCKMCLSKLLHSEPSSCPTDSINIQYENLVVLLGPLV